MSKNEYTINQTCSCGATYKFTEVVSESYYSKIATEHDRFLQAHIDCRVKAIIANGKELKMFLANVTPRPEPNETPKIPKF